MSRRRFARPLTALTLASLLAGAVGLLAVIVRRGRRSGQTQPAEAHINQPVPRSPITLAPDGELPGDLPYDLPAAPATGSHSPAQVWFSRLAALTGLVLLSVSAWVFQSDVHGDGAAINAALWRATAWLIAGGVALAGALYTAQRPSLPQPTPQTALFRRPRLRYLLPGVLCLALLGEISGGLLQIAALSSISTHAQMGLWVAGLVLVALGLSGGRLKKKKIRSQPESKTASLPGRVFRAVPRSDPDTLVLIAVTALALIVRAWRVGDLVHTFIDETLFVDAMMRVWEDIHFPMLLPTPVQSNIIGMFPYLQSGGILLFGRELEGIRAIAVLMGALTVPGLYLLGRELFNRRVGLIAALLLATFPPAVHLGRIGLYNSADALFGTWALALCAVGLRRNRVDAYAAAGVVLGVTHYFYEGGRLLYTPLLLLWLVGLALMWWRIHVRGWVTLLLALLIVTAPLYYAWWAHEKDFNPRMDEQIANNPFWQNAEWFHDNVRPPLLHFISTTDGSAFYYGGQTPLLLIYTAPLALFGVFFLLWRIRAPGALLPLLWVALTIAGNSLLQSNNWTARFVVVFPALALLTAVGLVGAVSLIVPEPVGDAPRRRWSVPVAFVYGAALTLTVLQSVYYFGTHLPYYNEQIRRHRDHIDIAYRARAFPPETRIYIVTANERAIWLPHYGTLRSFWGHPLRIELLKPEVIDEGFFAGLRDDVDLAFFLDPEDLATWGKLVDHLDPLPPQMSPYDIPLSSQFALYYVEVDDDQSGAAEQ